MKKVYHIKRAQSNNEIKGILELQAINSPANISTEELEKEGFVTVRHDYDTLVQINNEEQAAIALDDEVIVGYCLSMTTKHKMSIPVLIPFFETIDSLTFKGDKLSETAILVGGQVCIRKGYRGIGLFKDLHFFLKDNYHLKYKYMLTEISIRNQRSLNAHYKIGFENIHEYKSDDENWVVVAWDWSNY